MPNEIIIHVKAVNDTAPVFAKIKAEAKDLGETIAININEKVTQRLERDAQAAAGSSGGYARIGDTIGQTVGKHVSERISERINIDVNDKLSEKLRIDDRNRNRDKINVDVHGREHVSVDVDVDKKSLMERLAAFGKEAGEKFSGFFQDGFKSVAGGIFSGDIISTIFKGLTVAGIVAVAAPVLGAGISAALMTALGGGVVVAGLAGAFKDPRIQTAIFGPIVETKGDKFNPTVVRKGGLKDQLMSQFKDFSDYFRPALENLLASPARSKTGGRTGILGILDQIKPQVDSLGQTFGQVTDKLLNQGLVGMLQNLLPGVLRAMQGAAPFINTLADEMPGIGTAIGKFFDIINNNSAGSQLFFKDFLNALEKIIPLIGAIIGGFSNMYLSIRLFFAKLRVAAWEWAGGFLEAAEAALGWIPGLGAKFEAAKKKVHKFANDANKDLQNIKDVQVTVTLKTAFGHAWQAIHQITGALQAIGAVKGGLPKGPSGGFGSKKASGGVVGTAATGGARNGLTWVGEQGAELADLAPGSRVYSNADSMRMAGQNGAGAGPIMVNLVVDGRTLARAMVDPMRAFVNENFGGSVQTAYGR